MASAIEWIGTTGTMVVGVDTGYSNTLTMSSKPVVIRPTRIEYLGEDIESRYYGGKAASLWRLIRAELEVPNAWVIPCKYSLTRPEIVLGIIPKGKLYAVRSGAPVSMPGLLNTELNVPWDKLKEAITKVWDSWHSEHAKAYREQMKIDHDIGTGVVIQEMVPDILAAGVAFTNHPTNLENKSEFYPLIEYVDGVGEALVSGESSGKVADGTESWYLNLVTKLRKIARHWGPSDVEWCVSKDGTVYFVQQRALKFTQPVIETKEAEAFGNRKVLGIFKPIGAPKTMAGIVVSTDYDGDLSDKILYVSNFNPEYYKNMMKARAIICKNGGETCHAAILGREMGKASVSGSQWTPEFYLPGKPYGTSIGVVVNGTTGVVYEALPEDLEQSTDSTLVAVDTTPRIRPNMSISKIKWLADKILFRFYKVINDYHTGAITGERKNEVVDEIAHILASYYYIICTCELRHLVHHSTKGYNAGKFEGYVNDLGRRGVPLPRSPHRGKIERDYFYENGGIPQPESLQRALEVLQLVHVGFTEFSWTSSYGGAKWGAITKMVLDYLNGELTSTLFVDMAFNLQHNGGRAFNKFGWMTSFVDNMNRMLDAKKVSYVRLDAYTKTVDFTAYGYGTYVDFHEFANQHLLLPPELQLGPDTHTELLDTPVKWPCGCNKCGCTECLPDGKCTKRMCDTCRPCGCGECGCSRCFRATTNAWCMKFECTTCKCGCGWHRCAKCYKDGQCTVETCDTCHPCGCGKCGCARCFKYNFKHKCKSQECEDCVCDCGDCGCDQCLPNGCDDDDCQTCHPCECGECGCENCFKDGVCSDECNECNPCECGDCGCERCFSDGNCGSDECNECNPCDCSSCGCERCYPNTDGACEDDDCNTCNPCKCLEADCEKCHQLGCDCPKCYVDPNQGELALEPELTPHTPTTPDSCECDSCATKPELVEA